jgi:hypothetical protein
MDTPVKWDAFISHAVEDQESFVRNLAAMLKRSGMTIWYAETALQIGDSLSASINKGLANSRYGIVVISRHFMSKKWPNWELAGLVSRQNSEEQSVILPVWHGVTKQDVIDFSPPLVDLFALDTAVEGADEIALKLIRRIRPDIYSSTERAQLEKLASGEAMRDLQQEIETVREELEATKKDLAEYRCPYCSSPISSRGDAPLDEDQRDWGTVENFACGYSHFEGKTLSPCPSDPNFPRFEDYELRFTELKTDPIWKWRCDASGKTSTAKSLSLANGLGRTREEAAASYDRYRRITA